MTGKLEENSARGRPLSARTVAYCHAILRAALSDAVRDELIRRNVAQLVEPPRVRTPPVEPLTAAEAEAVLAAARGDNLHALWVVLLGLGLRRGEALGLQWGDIDFECQTIKISRSLQRLRGAKDPETGKHRGKLALTDTKTESSTASLALPQFVSDALRDHRQQQLSTRLAAPVWINPEFVFTSSVGTPLEPRNVNREWNDLLDRAHVRRVKLHATRHTTASLLLREGVDMKIVQSVLRHSRLSTTADIYSHVYDEVKRDAAQRLDSLLGTRSRSGT